MPSVRQRLFPWTCIKPSARFTMRSNRAEDYMPVHEHWLDVQITLCTLRPGLVPSPKYSPPVRSQRLDNVEVNFWFQRLFLFYEIIVECWPRPEIHVHVHSKNPDVQRLSIRSGLRWVTKICKLCQEKIRQKCSVL